MHEPPIIPLGPVAECNDQYNYGLPQNWSGYEHRIEFSRSENARNFPLLALAILAIAPSITQMRQFSLLVPA